MATTITPVTENNIRHCLLIDLTLDNTTYYISNAYKALTYNSNSYTECGAFLQVGQFQEDIKTTNGDVTIALSGIPSNTDYVQTMLAAPIKGGEVIIRRAFLGEDYEIDSGNVYQRFKGVITNFSISEDVSILDSSIVKSIAVKVASINTILENREAGQRTSPIDRRKFEPGDETFDRVPELHNVGFDFGREFTGGTGYGGGGGGGGGRGRTNRNFQQER